VFSKSPINEASPANLTNSFQSGDHIYGFAYFSKPIKKQCKGRMRRDATKASVEMLVYLNDQYKNSMNPTLKNDLLNGKIFRIDIAPEPANMTAYTDPNLSWGMYGDTKEGPLLFSQILSDLDEGKTKVKIEIKACYAVIASGEFTIEGTDFDFYAQLMDGLKNAETKTVQMPKAKRNDPALEKEMKALLKASSNDAWKGEIKKVVIIDRDWFIVRHKLTGAILHRYIRAEVAVKKTDGCWLYHLVTFKQNYIGSKFDNTYWDGAGDRVKIPCENVK
ncbi:hypothetical protein B1H10_02645, partial [candidate division KSB1 bacterium 4484_188]